MVASKELQSHPCVFTPESWGGRWKPSKGKKLSSPSQNGWRGLEITGKWPHVFNLEIVWIWQWLTILGKPYSAYWGFWCKKISNSSSLNHHFICFRTLGSHWFRQLFSTFLVQFHYLKQLLLTRPQAQCFKDILWDTDAYVNLNPLKMYSLVFVLR